MYCRELSAVQPLGDHESKCGYCSSPDGFSTFGALTRRLTCTDYQALIDHNWRRSGTYMYRPNQDATCCPLLTIRLDVEAFRASKQQNQLLRRMQRFLDGEIDLLGPAGGEDERGAASCKDEAAKPAPENAAQPAAGRLNAALAAAVNAAVDAGSLPSALRGAVLADGPTGSHPDITIRSAARAAAPAAAAARAAAAGGAVPAFSSPVAMRLAALARRAGVAAPSAGEVASAVAAAWAGSASCAAVAAAAVSERGPPFINFTLTDADVLAELAADSAESQRQADRSAVSDAAGRAQGETSSSSPRKRRMRVVAAPAVFEQESFELYKRYQKAVHGDKEKDLTVKQYTGFLCESPLVPMPLDSDAKGYADAAVGLVRSRSGAPEDLCRLALAVTASAGDAAGLLEASRGRLSDDQLRSRLREAASSGVGGYAQAAVRALREARRAGEGSGAGFPAKAEGSPLAAAGSDAAAAAGTAAGGAAAGGAAAGTAAGSGAAAAAGAASTAEPADVVGTLSGFGPGAVAHGLGAADAEGGTALAGGYGSYHHKYYLDDQLVAVGVVDVLPNCLVSALAAPVCRAAARLVAAHDGPRCGRAVAAAGACRLPRAPRVPPCARRFPLALPPPPLSLFLSRACASCCAVVGLRVLRPRHAPAAAGPVHCAARDPVGASGARAPAAPAVLLHGVLRALVPEDAVQGRLQALGAAVPRHGALGPPPRGQADSGQAQVRAHRCCGGGGA